MNSGLSVLPSVLLSGSFLEIGLLDFSETRHGVRAPCSVTHDRPKFSENIILPKKLAKKRVF